MADEQKVCKTCQRPISPAMLAASDSARRMPMCNECEWVALSIRPSPRDRKQKGVQQR